MAFDWGNFFSGAGSGAGAGGTFGPIGAGIGAAAGGIASLFGNNKKNNPANAANDYLNQIPGQTGKYYQPYQDAGREALGHLTNQYGQMSSDPNAVYNQLAGGYKESPGFQHQLQQALGASGNASAAGGMLGTPQHQEQNMQLASDMSSADFEKYLNHVIGLHSEGLSGESDINKMGYGANTEYANMLANVLGTQGQYSYAGQAGENTARSKGLADIFSGAGAAGGGIANYFANRNKPGAG